MNYSNHHFRSKTSNKTPETTDWQFLGVRFFCYVILFLANLYIHNFIPRPWFWGWMPVQTTDTEWNQGLHATFLVTDCLIPLWWSRYTSSHWNWREALPQPVRSIGERSVASDLCHQFMSYIILNFAKFRCLKLIEVDHRINAYIYIWIRMIRANTTSKFCFFSEEASWNKWFGLQDVWGPLSPKCATRLELSACHQALTDYLNPRIIPFQSVLVECPNRMQAWLIRQMTYLQREAQMGCCLLPHLCCPHLETQLLLWCISYDLYTYIYIYNIHTYIYTILYRSYLKF